MTEPTNPDCDWEIVDEAATLFDGPFSKRVKARELLLSHIAAAREEGRREAMQWRPIETAPNKSGQLEFVLVRVKEFSAPAVAALTDEGAWVTPDDYFDLRGTPTGWLPLPPQ